MDWDGNDLDQKGSALIGIGTDIDRNRMDMNRGGTDVDRDGSGWVTNVFNTDWNGIVMDRRRSRMESIWIGMNRVGSTGSGLVPQWNPDRSDFD